MTSLKDEVQLALVGLDYKELKVDKDADYRGRSGVKVSFLLDGDVRFETIITDDLGLTNAYKAKLIRRNAEKALQKYNRGKGKR